MYLDINKTYPDYIFSFYFFSCKSKSNYSFAVNDSSIDIDIKSIIKFIDNRKEDNIIFCVRGEMEPFTNVYPATEILDEIIENSKKNILIYYQEPWPAPIPNFSTDDNAVVIKFGYDEESEIDKSIADNVKVKAKKIPSKKLNNVPVLVNKKNVIFL